jgi:hypothetical protein
MTVLFVRDFDSARHIQQRCAIGELRLRSFETHEPVDIPRLGVHALRVRVALWVPVIEHALIKHALITEVITARTFFVSATRALAQTDCDEDLHQNGISP